MTHPTEGESWKMWETDEGSMSLSYSFVVGQLRHLDQLLDGHWADHSHTGTFFCERTTAQSLPRTPIDMMFAAVMALKAYSGDRYGQ